MALLRELLGESEPIAAVREQAGRLLRAAAGPGRRLPPILVLGETGTGKGLLASALHRGSARARSPFVDVNCAAIPETLLEAELFGFERGAFTDARQAKTGLFQAANGGTIFLDEVGLLPLALQAKLLKVIEERAVRRLGSTRSEPLDVSVIAATSEDLVAAVKGGQFRADLYHRLAVVTLVLPPLRSRGRDVLLLAEHFLARICEEYGLPLRVLTDDGRAALLAHAWPGNVRELHNVLERAALLGDEPKLTAAAPARSSARRSRDGRASSGGSASCACWPSGSSWPRPGAARSCSSSASPASASPGSCTSSAAASAGGPPGSRARRSPSAARCRSTRSSTCCAARSASAMPTPRPWSWTRSSAACSAWARAWTACSPSCATSSPWTPAIRPSPRWIPSCGTPRSCGPPTSCSSAGPSCGPTCSCWRTSTGAIRPPRTGSRGWWTASPPSGPSSW